MVLTHPNIFSKLFGSSVIIKKWKKPSGKVELLIISTEIPVAMPPFRTSWLYLASPFTLQRYEILLRFASFYFPDAKTKKGAMNNLNYWINYCSELREKLRELNTPPHAHRYTRREVELIVEYLCYHHLAPRVVPA